MSSCLHKNNKRAIQVTDKYLRNKRYSCLFPGCNETAIQSHAIQRASCAEALATNGVVYSLQQSYNMAIKNNSATDPLHVVKVGINDASVFKGFCPAHDTMLFAPAEAPPMGKNDGMYISLHLRALALEYCRKRRHADFLRKMAGFIVNPEGRQSYLSVADMHDRFCSNFMALYLGSTFNIILGSSIDSIEYFVINFSQNLLVSCCGCFNVEPDEFESVVAYNLISYSEGSLLVLTVFKAVERFLDAFLENYNQPQRIEQLVNDIAFFRCEEPLISPRLWLSLNDEERLAVRRSLRHPDYRDEIEAPRIIKLTKADSEQFAVPKVLARTPHYTAIMNDLGKLVCPNKL
ncbi:hypothetical protein FO488_07455 [Geobacter sp. FeAm09]|uniref:hypothetical protein n=1 Tax=Geobacter sp. FeAm09 TaxID=2597769 RepID=UPI0011EF6FE4|nr:hypothetical protein [Geobacter sp. FeAm09]QEM68010.1 hypothetical protein FO488_07455 [Geobacter sp. FeAm09]